MKTKISIAVALLIVAGLGIGFYLFNKPHADIASQDPIARLSASELFNAFSNDETAANQNYAGKVIEVNGEIYSIEDGNQGDYNILLMGASDMFGVSCNISKEDMPQGLSNGQQISTKGECSGMLSDVILIRCVILKK